MSQPFYSHIMVASCSHLWDLEKAESEKVAPKHYTCCRLSQLCSVPAVLTGGAKYRGNDHIEYEYYALVTVTSNTCLVFAINVRSAVSTF